MNIKCPTCKRIGDWFVGPHGPFCSKRCKMVDLGRWFSEEHVVSEPISDQDLEQLSQEGKAPAEGAPRELPEES